ncbi:Basic-leucine zipper (bZIP) transcription factor family protein [Raphanus sativus]|uniref:Basic leucine zipper 19 n=1 Tax=Raphanus sativus TaxID=3726 RepID=A0A6J0KHH5_RAPSA|nr:basic leucine zipper 19 [Raphanus sativus]KAJ4880790.1 Basic-leucine zipper (bZIP) transcription factor family protein [Raphanus sativus]
MEDGELEFSNMGVLLPPTTTCSMDTFFDDLLMMDSSNAACTHTHTCNPTGPENNAHTHTCFHVHTKILPEDNDDSDDKVFSTDDTAESCGKKGGDNKRPSSSGNREAVRKYREKKKAKAASLEDEVARLTAVNHQLLKRLQSQSALEAEVSRLKCLLVDLRGRIDGEIGSFPYQKQPNVPSFSHMMMNPCNVECGDDEVYCLQDGFGQGINEQGLSGCEFEQLQQCAVADQNLGNGSSLNSSANVSASNKRKGGHRARKAA